MIGRWKQRNRGEKEGEKRRDGKMEVKKTRDNKRTKGNRIEETIIMQLVFSPNF